MFFLSLKKEKSQLYLYKKQLKLKGVFPELLN